MTTTGITVTVHSMDASHCRKPASKLHVVMRVPRGKGDGYGAEHREAACMEEAPNQHGRENEKGDVEPGRVIPSDGGLNHARVALCRDETEGTEDQFHDQRGAGHRSVERREQKDSPLPSVISAIDVHDREDDQIRN